MRDKRRIAELTANGWQEVSATVAGTYSLAGAPVRKTLESYFVPEWAQIIGDDPLLLRKVGRSPVLQAQLIARHRLGGSLDE